MRGSAPPKPMRRPVSGVRNAGDESWWLSWQQPGIAFTPRSAPAAGALPYQPCASPTSPRSQASRQTSPPDLASTSDVGHTDNFRNSEVEGKSVAAKFEIRQPKAGQFNWVLISQGRTLATGESYGRKVSAQNAIESLRKAAATATVVDLTLAPAKTAPGKAARATGRAVGKAVVTAGTAVAKAEQAATKTPRAAKSTAKRAARTVEKATKKAVDAVKPAPAKKAAAPRKRAARSR